VERVLETYTLSEIIEDNELTEEEVLQFLLEQEFIKLPLILPVDINDD
jgi:hypothetical protein